MRAVLVNIVLLAMPAFGQTNADLATISGSTLGVKAQPLKKSSVILQPVSQAGQNGPPPQPYGTTSDAQGHYEFNGVEPGRYILRAEHAGYLSTPYRAQSTGPGPVVPISLAPRQVMKDVNIQLNVEAVLSGRVLDEDGEPLARASVRALRRNYIAGGQVRYQPVGYANTDDNGDYKMTGLAAGKFLLVATVPSFAQSGRAPGSKAAEGQLTTFYPFAREITAAEFVEVGAAEQTTGKNIRMRKGPVFHIRGKAPVSGQPDQRTMVSLAPGRDTPGGAGASTFRTTVGQDGSFDFGGLEPGPYTVSLVKLDDGTSGGGQQFVAMREVKVTSHDLEGVTLEPIVFGEFSGIVKTELPAQEWRILLTAFDAAVSGANASAVTKPDGSFTVSKLAPGQYRVGVASLPAKAYVKSLKIGGKERVGLGIDLTEGVSGKLEITVASDGTELPGTVKNKDGAAASTCTVTLLPDLAERTDRYRQATCDAQGKFRLRAVPPGNYRVFAWSNLETGEQFDPEFMKLHQRDGQPVQVVAGVAQELSLLEQ